MCVCMCASQRTRSVIIYCPVNLDLLTEMNCLEQTQRRWNSGGFWNVWLAFREGIEDGCQPLSPGTKGITKGMYMERKFVLEWMQKMHTHIHNHCYSMYPSWLASTRLSPAYCDPFFLHPQDSLSLIDFIAPMNTLSTRRCDGDNSIIECLLDHWRMPSCWTNLEHAHANTRTKTHTVTVEQVIEMTSKGYPGQHGFFDV